MIRIFRTGLLMLVTALCVAVGFDVRGETETSQRRKARYYYSAASVCKATGDEASAYEYYKRAYNTDPEYAEAAIAYGMTRLELPLDTMQSDTEVNRSLAMMRQFVDKYPDDVNESQYYGYVATQLGNTAEAVRVLERTYAQHPTAAATLLQLSDAYAVNKEIDKAVEAMDRYERSEGLNPQVTMRKVQYLMASQDTVRALQEVSRLLASDTRNVSYNVLKGNLFDVIEQKDSALYYYQRAERMDPESGMAKLSLAGYYQQVGDSVAYDKKMYEVLLSEDLDLDMKSDMLAQYLQNLISGKQDTQRGDYLFSVLQNQYPHEPRVLDLAARYSAAKNDFSDAVDQISYAIDLDPTNMVYWGQLMTYQASDGHPEESLKTYERAKTHVEPDQSMRFLYALMAQNAKRYDLAIEAYKEMINEVQEGLPVDSVLTLKDVRRDISLGELDMLSNLIASLGDIYHSAGNKQQAFRMYENALTFDPSNALAANNYAYFLCLDGGDLEKALELSRKSLAGDNGSNPTYLDTFAWIQFLKGNYEEALETQQKAVTENEKVKHPSPELYDHYGDILKALGRDEDARDAWQKALRIMEEEKMTDEPEYGKTAEKLSNQ